MSQDYQKVKIYQNLTTESGSKQRFSLLQEKVVIQAVYLRTQIVSLKARFYVLKEGYEYLAMEHLIEKNVLYNYLIFSKSILRQPVMHSQVIFRISNVSY